MEELKHNPLEWGVAGMALPGSVESGDKYVCQVSAGSALVAVIDGLGHGAQAAVAATEACGVLESEAGENVIALVRACHEKLKPTRGVAMSLGSFDFGNGLLTWLGVGNVRGILLPGGGMWNDKEDSLLQRPGVVGSHLPRLQAAVLPLSEGDTVVFSTDGIEDSFDRAAVRGMPPQRAADLILARHAKRNDDALVLIARYRGNSR